MKIGVLNNNFKVNKITNNNRYSFTNFKGMQDVFAKQPKVFYFENKILPRQMQKEINITYQKAINEIISTKNDVISIIKNIEDRGNTAYTTFQFYSNQEKKLYQMGEKYALEAFNLLKEGEENNFQPINHENNIPKAIYKKDDQEIRVYAYSENGTGDLFILKQKDKMRITKHTIQGLIHFDYELPQNKKGEQKAKITHICSKPNSYQEFDYKYANGHITMEEEFSGISADFTKKSIASGYKKSYANNSTITKKTEEFTFDKNGATLRYTKNSEINSKSPIETYSTLIDFYDDDIIYSQKDEYNNKSIIARFDNKNSLQELTINKDNLEVLSCHKFLKYLNYIEDTQTKTPIINSFYKDENGKLQYRRLDA